MENESMNAVATGEAANLEPITREEMFLAKLGGADVKIPTPITRKEYFLQKAIEGGGGGGVTDYNDLINKPCYSELVEIFPETAITFEAQEALDGMVLYMAEISSSFDLGETYQVSFDGVDYVCKCTYPNSIGNVSVIDESVEPTNEPFFANSSEGLLVVIPLTGVESTTMSIRKQEIIPLDNKYMADPYVLDLVALGAPSIDTTKYGDKPLDIDRNTYVNIVESLKKGGFWVRLKTKGYWGVGVETSTDDATAYEEEVLLFLTTTEGSEQAGYECVGYYKYHLFIFRIFDGASRVETLYLNPRKTRD